MSNGNGPGFVPEDFARALALACEAEGVPLPAEAPTDHESLNAAGADVGLSKKVLADALYRAQMEKLSEAEREDLGLVTSGSRAPKAIAAVIAALLFVAAVAAVIFWPRGDGPRTKVTGDIDEAALESAVDAVVDGARSCEHPHGEGEVVVALRVGTDGAVLKTEIQGDDAIAVCVREAVDAASFPEAIGAPVDVGFRVSVSTTEEATSTGK